MRRHSRRQLNLENGATQVLNQMATLSFYDDLFWASNLIAARLVCSITIYDCNGEKNHAVAETLFQEVSLLPRCTRCFRLLSMKDIHPGQELCLAHSREIDLRGLETLIARDILPLIEICEKPPSGNGAPSPPHRLVPHRWDGAPRRSACIPACNGSAPARRPRSQACCPSS